MDFVAQQVSPAQSVCTAVSTRRTTALPVMAFVLLFFIQGMSVADAQSTMQTRSVVQDATPFSIEGANNNAANEIQSALTKGLEFERARMWGEAIGHYEKFTRKFPQDAQLYQRMVISRLYYDVNRRFKDESYLQSLRELSTNEALDLYSEILANLQTHYVDDVDWARILVHGTAALEVALNEDAFVDRVLPNTNREAIANFRNSIHTQLQSRSTATRFDLRAAVSTVAQRANAELGLSGTAVALEYLSGAVSTLDPYTRLLSPSQLDEMFSNIEGNFVGLGVELKAKTDYLQVLSVIPGGPAAEAGLLGGEKIIGVGGERTESNDPEYVADLLRGPEHSYVAIDVVSAQGVERTINVQRRRVEVPCVENVHFVDPENRVGYLRLTNFQKTTTRDVERALWDLHRQGMRSLIIDVRGNPGGLLSAAVEVADRFISEGPIVTTRGRNVRENYDYKAHRPNTWSIPLAVLIDGDSASASEIFAGAIADSRRGEIIGETSYGKGSVQGIFRMQSAKFGLCLTTAKFYSPSGRAISQNGVMPTIEVEPTHIAARPDSQGHITLDREDSVLQRAVMQISGRPMISQLNVGK
ncbi:putative CtpA-like serine protease [Rubripirellula amarantea]|uniref:Putative CtpA-like serine protease n=1 Tax=Rubripirellula amarantea TaxID=2527999 RepID=A0A5C5WWK2_9BACT|nr:S41 family peptidase [Rubripirellula amarantea]TWT55086.1 putative CtpA-like serine protease [Rubripirellula amarantea]